MVRVQVIFIRQTCTPIYLQIKKSSKKTPNSRASKQFDTDYSYYLKTTEIYEKSTFSYQFDSSYQLV